MDSEQKRKELLDLIHRIELYSRNDFVSYEQITSNQGNCSVGMISHSVAVLDWLSYLLSSKSKVGKRIEEVLQRYSNETSNPAWQAISANPDLLYNVIRCGVVHQFYGKATIIKRFPNNDSVVCDIDGRININPNGLYKMITDLLEKSRHWISSANQIDIEAAYDRTQKRQADDMNTLSQALSFLTIPKCPSNEGKDPILSTSTRLSPTEPTSSMA